MFKETNNPTNLNYSNHRKLEEKNEIDSRVMQVMDQVDHTQPIMYIYTSYCTLKNNIKIYLNYGEMKEKPTRQPTQFFRLD